jgi:hypothetical protein
VIICVWFVIKEQTMNPRRKRVIGQISMLTCKWVGRGTLSPNPKGIGSQTAKSVLRFAATGDTGIVRANDTGRPYNVGGK